MRALFSLTLALVCMPKKHSRGLPSLQCQHPPRIVWEEPCLSKSGLRGHSKSPASLYTVTLAPDFADPSASVCRWSGSSPLEYCSSLLQKAAQGNERSLCVSEAKRGLMGTFFPIGTVQLFLKTGCWNKCLGGKRNSTCNCLATCAKLTLGFQFTGSLSICNAPSYSLGTEAHMFYNFLKKANSKYCYQDSENVVKNKEHNSGNFPESENPFFFLCPGNKLLRVKTDIFKFLIKRSF